MQRRFRWKGETRGGNDILSIKGRLSSWGDPSGDSYWKGGLIKKSQEESSRSIRESVQGGEGGLSRERKKKEADRGRGGFSQSALI